MQTIGICGHFGKGLDLSNGQTIKTKILTEALTAQLGPDAVRTVDSHGGPKQVPRMAAESWQMFRHCKNILMLPAYKGLLIFAPLYLFYNLFFHRKLHYVVIGGWLDSFLDRHRWIEPVLKRFDGIYVETTTMQRALEKRGFSNLVVLPNFKPLTPVEGPLADAWPGEPYRLCTFSRVMEKKGIGDAVQAVETINREAGRTVCTLDIYGPVWSDYTDAFAAMEKQFSPAVRYGGVIPFAESVPVLRDYFALLFPTQFYTEGIPGTLIDAYAAGVPVLCARWESYSDVVDEGRTGRSYPFGEADGLLRALRQVLADPNAWMAMKEACRAKAETFSPACAVQILLDRL